MKAGAWLEVEIRALEIIADNQRRQLSLRSRLLAYPTTVLYRPYVK